MQGVKRQKGFCVNWYGGHMEFYNGYASEGREHEKLGFLDKDRTSGYH